MRSALSCLFVRDFSDRMLRLVLRQWRGGLRNRPSLAKHAGASVGGELHARLVLPAYASDCGI